ncbi:MAG: FprA family A-type flavoprotein [Thermoanaerobaculaceae bacterium]|nr:FprA family A-type flavoprotein [Thermoanaerobaculaceae bacterium]
MEIANSVHYVGISTNELKIFENLWELDYGVTFNSYLINGEKKALIDACPSNFFNLLKNNIEKICPIKELSYLVLNHLEPDHSEAVLNFLEDCPEIQILTTKMGANMLLNFYGVKERVKEVKEGEIIDLGGYSLKFISSPFIHWPETMMTFEETTKTLFSCDCFGGFGEIKDKIFAEENKDDILEEERYRYFVNILASYTKHIEKAIAKIETMPVSAICPSHGLIYKEPKTIIEKYKKWCGYSSGINENYIPVVASTMYGMTLKAAEKIKNIIKENGVGSELFDLSNIPPSFVLKEIYKAKGIIFLSPTYDGLLFPKTSDFLFRARAKEIKNKKVAFAGSFAWAGGALKEFEEWCKVLNWELIGSAEFKGSPEQYAEKLENLARTFLQSFEK